MPTGPGGPKVSLSLSESVNRIRRCAVFIGALVVLYAVLATSAEGYVYWTNEQDGTIGRANPNGTGKNQGFIKTGGSPAAVAVDGAHIYWGHRTGGDESIGRANLDGSGKNPNFIPFLALPSGVAANATHLFWTEAIEDGCDLDLTNCLGYVGRANLNGTGIDYGFIRPKGGTQGVAVNATHIFFAFQTGEAATGFIGRANLSGSGVNQSLVSGLNEPGGISVNSTHIFWANLLGTTIGRANLNGTGANNSFIKGVDVPCATAVDADHVYWTDLRRDTIGRANLDGSGIDRNFITGAKQPCGIAIDSLGADEFGFGKVKRNKRKGTAKLTVLVPRAGAVELAASKTVKGAAKRAEGEGSVKLPIKPKGKSKKKLNKRGKANVKAEVTYTPDGGAASTQATSVKLKKRR